MARSEAVTCASAGRLAHSDMASVLPSSLRLDSDELVGTLASEELVGTHAIRSPRRLGSWNLA
eukprot:3046060-Pleurochrysis_carterae.AAC.1